MPYVTKTEQENIKKMLSLDIKDKWQLKNIADPNGMYSGSFILESFNSKYDGIIHENTYEAQKARENRSIEYSEERYKQVRSSEYDILDKIKMYKEIDNDDVDEPTATLNTDERTIVDLINTVTIHKGDVNLLEELMAGGDTTGPIEEEQSKKDLTNEISEYIDAKKLETKETESLQSQYSQKNCDCPVGAAGSELPVCRL